MTEEPIKLTPIEEVELKKFMGENPFPEEKQGLFSFFSKILKTDDTKKVSYLDTPEINAVRILENVASYAKFMNNDKMQKYFRDESETVLATALSKKGFFVKQAVTIKKEAKLTTSGGEKSKWFKKKEEGD